MKSFVIIRKILGFTKEALCKYILSSGGVLLYTTLIGLYWGAIGTWKDEWPFFKDHLSLHQTISIISIIVAVLLALMAWIFESNEGGAGTTSEQLLLKFIDMTGSVVRSKLVRFRSIAKTLSKKDKFRQITRPNEQIEVIFSEASNFMRYAFSLNEDQLDFTILEKMPGQGWAFGPRLKVWNHDDPSGYFATSNTTASCVYASGGSVFHSSKKLAEAEGKYKKSARDIDKGDGSIFSSYSKFETPTGNFEFVFSIVTYGRRLCDPWQDSAVKVTDVFCKEISRRIDLELCLHVIKKS